MHFAALGVDALVFEIVIDLIAKIGELTAKDRREDCIPWHKFFDFDYVYDKKIASRTIILISGTRQILLPGLL